MNINDIHQILGEEAESLLTHQSKKITYHDIYRPHDNQIEHIFKNSDRSQAVIANLKRIYNHGRLGGTGYLSILPVDQGLEHNAAYSFYQNPIYFDPENIVKLAIAGGCNGVVSSVGILGLISKKYADKIPFIVKINHNNSIKYPFEYKQIEFASVKQAAKLGAVAVGATIYFGSKHSDEQIINISKAFYQAHQLGLGTILWCYTRNKSFRSKDVDYHTAADLTGQANYLGVNIEADIIKQKLPTTDKGGFSDLNFSKHNPKMYQRLMTAHPIDLVRYQVAHCFMGKIPLINSGGRSLGDKTDDFKAAIRTAVINKRGGGSGLMMGRKAFKKEMAEGIKILNAVQDVYLEDRITIA